MDKIINFEALVAVALAAWVIARLIEALKAPVKDAYEAAPKWVRVSVQYGAIALGAGLAWFTALNMFPGFSAVWPPLGRIMTCIGAGLGPSWVYDTWMDRPKQPES